MPLQGERLEGIKEREISDLGGATQSQAAGANTLQQAGATAPEKTGATTPEKTEVNIAGKPGAGAEGGLEYEYYYVEGEHFASFCCFIDE
jgi:hypothetical protein